MCCVESKREWLWLPKTCDFAHVKREDPLYLSDDFGVGLAHVAGRDDAFRRSTVEMGTRVAYQSITAFL